jgi:ribosomal protein S18 acetylase RimI-like enzyme
MLKILNQGKTSTKYSFIQNDEQIGTFHIVSSDDHKEIWCFGIHSDKKRNQGLGQQMLRECLDMLAENIVELGCLKDNYRALHIYHKFGFVIVKDCGEYYWMRREVK